MIINNISKAIAFRIAKELSLPGEKQEVIEYGMLGILSQLLSILLLSGTALIFNMVKEAIVVGVCSASLRKYSGGAHCSSPLRCGLLSAFVVPILVFFARFVSLFSIEIQAGFVFLVNLLTAAVFYVYAPKDTPSKPIRNKEKIRKLKIKTLSLWLFLVLTALFLFYLNFRQVSILMTVGMANQAFTLTRPGHICIDIFDKVLRRVTK